MIEVNVTKEKEMVHLTVEQEVIALNVFVEELDALVNHELLQLPEGRRDETSAKFRGESHAELFLVKLTDFLSPLAGRRGEDLAYGLPRPCGDAPSSDFSSLFYLRLIAERPHLHPNAIMISKSVQSFSKWLEEHSHLEKYRVGSLGVQVPLSVRRMDWLKICGNCCKHRGLRTNAIQRKVVRFVADAVGCSVDDLNPRGILDEFFERFFDDILGYHQSTIVELVNDIRWAIHEYLRVPFQDAFMRGNERPAYSYCIPHHVNSQRGQDSFRALMESYRGGPPFPKFSTDGFLKLRY